jgi:hypothetical protein
MACKIEIEKSINESIDKELPFRGAIMLEKKAKAIVEKLNTLWSSAITKVVSYHQHEGFRVSINSLTDAIDKEFQKQELAEKEFERDLAFFNGDESLLEQDSEQPLGITNTSRKEKLEAFETITANNYKKIEGVLSRKFGIKEIGGKLYYILNAKEQTIWKNYNAATRNKSNLTKTNNGFVLEDKSNLSIIREDKDTKELFYFIDLDDKVIRVKLDLLFTSKDDAELKNLQSQKAIFDEIAERKEFLKNQRILLAERRLSEKLIGSFAIRNALHNIADVYRALTDDDFNRNDTLELTEEQAAEIKESFVAFKEQMQSLMNIGKDFTNEEKSVLIKRLLDGIKNISSTQEELDSVLTILETLPNNLLGRIVLLDSNEGFMGVQEEDSSNPLNDKLDTLKKITSGSLFAKYQYHSRVGAFYSFLNKNKNLFISKEDIKNINRYIIEKSFESDNDVTLPGVPKKDDLKRGRWKKQIPLKQTDLIKDLIIDNATKQGLSDLEILDLLTEYEKEIDLFSAKARAYAKETYPTLYDVVESTLSTVNTTKKIVESNIVIAFAHYNYSGVQDHVFAHELGHTIDSFLFENKPEVREDLYQFIDYLLNFSSPEDLSSYSSDEKREYINTLSPTNNLVETYLQEGLYKRGYWLGQMYEIAPDIIGALTMLSTEQGTKRLEEQSFLSPMVELLKSNDSVLKELYNNTLAKYEQKEDVNLSLYEKIKKFFSELIDSLKEFLRIQNKDVTSEELSLLDGFLNVLNKTILQEDSFKDFPTTSVRDRKANSTTESQLKSSTASPKTIAIVQDFLNRIGVNLEITDNIYVDGQKIDAEGIAKITQSLVQVIDGTEATSLTEEAMHFAVEILEQTNPKLFNQMLKEIGSYSIYEQVRQEYSQLAGYQTEDGKPNIRKIKKEAIGKVLAEVVINQSEGMTDKPELLQKVNSWWNQITEFFKKLFPKSGFDKAAMDILSGKNIGTVDDIKAEAGEYYLQATPTSEQQRIVDSIKTVSKGIENTGDGYEKDGVKIPNRVSDIIKTWYERQFANKALVESDYVKGINALKAEKGTQGHAVFEYVFNLFVDENGFLRETPLDDADYEIKHPDFKYDFYKILKDNLEQRLKSFPEDTVFMAEQILYDAKRKLAGTVDFVAITPAGKVNILDWKFMDLNVDVYEDIPWYKIKAWNLQMEQYKTMISSVYGVKNENFDQTMMIPIKAYYTTGDYARNIYPELEEIEIGDVVIKNITQDYLIPVGLKEQSTGNEKIDELLTKLNAIYTKLSEQKVTEETKFKKAEQLNALFYAIRQLQMKQNVAPLIIQARILNKQINNLLAKYDTQFKDKLREDFAGEKQKEVEEFTKEIETLREALDTYVTLDLDLDFIFENDDSVESKQLETDMGEAVKVARKYADQLKTLDSKFTETFIGGTATPEKIIKGIGKLFGTASTIQLESLSALYKKANKAFKLAGMDTNTEINKLNDIKKKYQAWAASRGLTIKNQFNILKKADKNELIDEFNPEFYKTLKDKINHREFKWIIDNIDVAAYRAYLAEKKKEEYARIYNKLRIGTEEQIDAEITKERNKIDKLYNTTEVKSAGWLLYNDVAKFPKRELWESTEWKNINKPENAPAKEFYDYIIERNNYYMSIGYIHARQARVFLPWVRKSYAEKLIFGGNVTLGEQFLRNISIDENDIGFGKIDPLTGKVIDTIPIYLTSSFEEEYSTDLFKTMAMYNEFATKFKYLSDIEAQARALLRLEKNKKAIATSAFGRTEYKNNVLQFTPDNSSNSKLVEDMIKGIIYQQKYITSESFDQLLGKLGGLGTKINAKIGAKVFPENIENRQVSVNKVIDQINSTFQLNALGLNILSATSNLFGGSTQSILNAGKYFTKAEHFANELTLGAKLLGEDGKKLLAAREYFLPFASDYNSRDKNKLSLSNFNSESVQDFLMFLMRNGEDYVRIVNFFSFLQNSIIQDGKIVNTREYLRSTPEYKAFYAGTSEERKARAAKFEVDVVELNKKQGVLALSSVVDGKFVIPGIERKSDSVIELSRMVESFTFDALGTVSPDNKRTINMTIYGNSLMIFKNWIPRLVDVRMGNIKYNSGSDAYEWGRSRMVARIISEDLTGAMGNLKNALVGNDKGIDFVRELYEKKKYDYERDTNKPFNMTEDEFIGLVKQNIKNQLYDVLAIAAMWALWLGLKALAPDKDEDPIVKNRWKFMLKATDKFRDELSYFYDPTSISQLVGKGIWPSLGLLENYGKVMKNFTTEMYALGTGNEELEDNTKVIKHVMRAFPMSSQAASLLPMFYPELAKDLGIKVASQYGIR